MLRSKFGYLAALLLCAFQSIANIPSEQVYYDGQLWVQFDANTGDLLPNEADRIDLQDLAAILGAEFLNEFGINRVRKPFHFSKHAHIREVYQLFFEDAGKTDELIQVLERRSDVGYVERIPIMRPTLTPNDLGPEGGNNNQWFLWRIDAQEAWDITTGSTDIKVAIVDDAVLTTHPDLIPNLLPGYDVADNDFDAMPNSSDMTHGTHVAGIAGAATNNGIGIASVGFNVKIIPVKSSNQGQVITDAYSGVIWASENGADVINMSWGGSGFSQTGQNIINAAYGEGCINVAAAGNDDVSSVFYPAGYANVISVASTTTNDAKSGFSNYGSWIDVAAPGSAIRSTYFNGSFQPTYANLQGTSMASPLVAGLCGLIWSVNTEMTQTQVTDCLLSTCDNIDGANSNYIGLLGNGRINAFQAVQCAQATVNAPPFAMVGSTNTVSCPGGLIQFFGSSSGGLATSYNWSFPGGNPATSTEQNPVVSYSALGNYTVSLTVSNPFGEHSVTETDFIEVSANGIDVFFSEDFETGSYADMGWSIDNPDGAITWDLFNVNGSVSGSRAAGINLFNYNAAGQRDAIETPVLDLSNHFNVQLDFKHAHRRYATDFQDSLIVLVSTDGGASFPHRLLQVAENGSGNFATGVILDQNFVPSNGSDWCFGGDIGSECFSLDLSEFDGEQNVKIRFEVFNDYGNNIYLDDVELSGNCLLVQAAPIAAIQLTETTVCAGTPVQFIDASVNIPTNFAWSFPGGNPATSSAPAPSVVYDEPGTYSVTLFVSNPFGEDEIVMTNVIEITSAPVVTLAQDNFVICEGSGAELIADGADTYTWQPANGLSNGQGSSVTATPDSPITYTVTGTGPGGCTSSASVSIDILPAPEEPTVITDEDPAFLITEPLNASGFYTFTSTAAGWGSPALGNFSIEAPLVIARDNTEGDSLLCNPAINGAELNGSIAVIYRGGCEFGAKALNAQNAGALGVIIVNNTDEPLIELGPGVQGPNVSIPVMMITQADGAALNTEITEGSAIARMGNFGGGPTLICPGDLVQMAAPAGWVSYEWSTDSSEPIIEVNNGGSYTVTVFDENGCGATSENYAVSVAAQAVPVINQNGNTLNAGVGAAGYQWFLNGEPIDGATSQSFEISENGEYSVLAFNSIGCEAQSEPFNATYVGIDDFGLPAGCKVYPNPASDRISVEVNEPIEYVRIFGADGRMVLESMSANEGLTLRVLNTSQLASGSYLLEVRTTSRSYRQQIVVLR